MIAETQQPKSRGLFTMLVVALSVIAVVFVVSMKNGSMPSVPTLGRKLVQESTAYENKIAFKAMKLNAKYEMKSEQRTILRGGTVTERHASAAAMKANIYAGIKDMKKVVLAGLVLSRRRLTSTKEKADPFANKQTLENAAESKKEATKGAVNVEMKAKTLAKEAEAAEEVAEQEAKDAADAAAKQSIKDASDAATKQATKDAIKDEEKAAKKAMEADSETKAVQKTATDKTEAATTTTPATAKEAKAEIKELKAEIKTDKKALPEADTSAVKKSIKKEIKTYKSEIETDNVIVLDAEMKKSAKGTSTKASSEASTLPEGVTQPAVGTTLLPPKKNSKLGQVEGEVVVEEKTTTGAKTANKDTEEAFVSSKSDKSDSKSETKSETKSTKAATDKSAQSSSSKSSASADQSHRLLPSVHTVKGVYKAMKGQIKTSIIMAKPYILKTSAMGGDYASKHDAIRNMKFQIKGAINSERGVVELDDDDDYAIRKLVDETKEKIEKKLAARA